MTSSTPQEAFSPAPAVSKSSRARSILFTLLKFAVAGAILGFLLYRNWDNLVEVARRPKNWRLFALAFALCSGAVILTFIRWYLLVWAQGLPFRLGDAIRLGFVGYVFNFILPGQVGGDFVKAMFLAREQKRRTVAVATVIFDRLIGLLALFWVGALASLVLWPQIGGRPELRQMAFYLWGLTSAGLIGLGVLLSPRVYRWRWVQRTTKLPLVGRILGELFNAVGTYQEKMPIVLIAGMMSLVCHTAFVLSFSLVAIGLGSPWVPSIGEHFLMFPLAMFVGSVIPVPAGLGVTEGAFAVLYQLVRPATVSLAQAEAIGVGTAVSYRAMMLVIAAVGGVIYFLQRREIDRVLHEATDTEPAGDES